MQNLALPFTDVRKLPIIHLLRKLKRVSYGYIKQDFINLFEDYLLQIKVFNYFENYELSAKFKTLCERTLIEFVKCLVYYKSKIKTDSNFNSYELDLLANYFILSQHILFDVPYSKMSLLAEEQNIYSFYNTIVDELNAWYFNRVESKREVAKCSV